jgi:hypothetical protein
MQATYTFDEDTVSDLHKDAYGFRPKTNFWNAWNSYDEQQKQDLWDSMCGTLERNLELEREMEDEAAVHFENTLATMMHVGAKSKEMAIGWLHDAHDTNGDDNYLEFKFGLRYGYIQKTLAV